jgi:hypothetical protein
MKGALLPPTDSAGMITIEKMAGRGGRGDPCLVLFLQGGNTLEINPVS